eukprot:399468_1
MGDCFSATEQKEQDNEYTPPNHVAKNQNNNTNPTQHDKAIQYGLDIMRKGFVKVDHFDNIYRIQPKYEGSPNLRQASGFNIYGTGQPNKSSILSLLNIWFKDMNLSKCLWINMRSEPVIYVQDISLSPRDPKHPSENIDFDEGIITINDLNTFNIELEKTVKQNITSNNNIFVYHKDTFAPLPADRQDRTLEFKCNDANDVYSLQSLYNSFQQDGYNIELARITVLDEKAPQPKDIVQIVDAIRNTDDNCVVIFNCMMGKGRTTEGMIMACLVKQILRGDKEQNLQENYSDKWPHDVPQECEEFVSFQKKIMDKDSDEKKSDEYGELGVDDMKKGNYKLIGKLVDLLVNEYGLDGNKIKNETDDIIDKCQHLQNMRECIYLSLLRYIYEERDNHKGYWKKISKQYLSRYYVLIVFNAYLNDVVVKQKKQLGEVTYVEWINDKPLIYGTMGSLKNGALAEFSWN